MASSSLWFVWCFRIGPEGSYHDLIFSRLWRSHPPKKTRKLEWHTASLHYMHEIAIRSWPHHTPRQRIGNKLPLQNDCACGMDSMWTAPVWYRPRPPRHRTPRQHPALGPAAGGALTLLPGHPYVVMVCLLLRDSNILPKQELHKSLQVDSFDLIIETGYLRSLVPGEQSWRNRLQTIRLRAAVQKARAPSQQKMDVEACDICRYGNLHLKRAQRSLVQTVHQVNI